jgi:hypothetical protein
VTKKTKAGNNKKRRNATAHDRTMTDPEVRKAFNALRDDWNNLSPQQRGEQLQKLVDSGCSIRGLERDLGEPASNIRRCIAQANSSDESGDWITMMERTLAKEPEKEDAMKAHAVALGKPPKILAKLGVEPVIKQKCLAPHHAQPSEAEQEKKITSPLSIAAKEPPAVNETVNKQEDRAGQQQDLTMSLVDRLNLSEQIRRDKIQRLASISESFEPRPYRDVRSMKRQGRPLPPKD